MANNLYGGIIYPNTSFVFDKIYPNKTEMEANANTDGVLIGRYVLVAYSKEAFNQDERNQIIGNTDEENPEPLPGELQADIESYYNNYLKDNTEALVPRSYDRMVYRKKYNVTKKCYEYESIASLTSTLSEKSIAVKGLKEGELALSIDKSTGQLSSVLSLSYDAETHMVQLFGKEDEDGEPQLISQFDASSFIVDGMIDTVELTTTDNVGNPGHFLKIQWNTAAGKQDTYISMADLVDVYTAGNGIDIDNDNNISIKLDNENESGYLSVGTNGLKLSGISTKFEEIDGIFSALEDQDIVINPTCKVEWSVSGPQEIGTKITEFTGTLTFEDGKYKYPLPGGTNAGCSATTYHIQLDTTSLQDDTNSSITLNPNITIDSETNLTAQAWIDYSASSVTPVTNLGREALDKQIPAGTARSMSTSISGYREGFFHGTLNTKIEPTDLASNIIRKNLSKTRATYTPGVRTVNVDKNTATIIFACPAEDNITGITNILNTTVNANMNEAFELSDPIKIEVGGADATETSIGNYPAFYNVWMYSPEEAYINPVTLKVTLG